MQGRLFLGFGQHVGSGGGGKQVTAMSMGIGVMGAVGRLHAPVRDAFVLGDVIVSIVIGGIP